MDEHDRGTPKEEFVDRCVFYNTKSLFQTKKILIVEGLQLGARESHINIGSMTEGWYEFLFISIFKSITYNNSMDNKNHFKKHS